MAKIKLNPLFAGISGKVGNLVIKKSKNGGVIVAKSPDMARVKPSKAQLAQRKAFEKASEYAKSALADETRRAFYEALAEARKTTARALCIADYLKAPTVDDLVFSQYHGQVGDRIWIMTDDNVGVVEVNVKLSKADGTLIEYGKAVEQYAGSGYWEYVATVPVPLGTDIFISAEAFDRPGNRATASANPVVGESH
jgi:hypothetical protein